MSGIVGEIKHEHASDGGKYRESSARALSTVFARIRRAQKRLPHSTEPQDMCVQGSGRRPGTPGDCGEEGTPLGSSRSGSGGRGARAGDLNVQLSRVARA
eukprot:384085-Rhodomonas_salina.1